MCNFDNFEFVSLVPVYDSLIIKTKEDVIFLGKENIDYLVRYWRREAKDLGYKIKETDIALNFLQNKSIANILKESKQFENPIFPKKKDNVNNDSENKWPEPSDDASLARQPNTTTFNVCGWCKYTCNSISRHYYMIVGDCRFDPNVYFQHFFNSPCIFQNATDETLNAIRMDLKYQLKKIIRQKRNTDEKIQLLLNLKKQAEKKPPFPENRPYLWLNIGDTVMVYTGDWKKHITSNLFITAKVIKHYDNGVLRLLYEQRVNSDKTSRGYESDCGGSRPEIMHPWELKYLLEHSSYAKLWAENDRTSSFRPNCFLAALSREKTK